MRLNLRTKNILPQAREIDEFAHGYFKMLYDVSKKMDMSSLKKAFKVLEKSIEGGHLVYVAGNGGSAAIANHLCCDWTKGTSHKAHKTLKTHSLVSNTALLTALANDLSYEEAIAEQVDLYCNPKDVIILISSSGNSPNILKAAETAQKKGVIVVGMTGFDGGKLKNISDIAIHVPGTNYGVVEDCHQSLMHILAQYIGRIRDESPKARQKK